MQSIRFYEKAYYYAGIVVSVLFTLVVAVLYVFQENYFIFVFFLYQGRSLMLFHMRDFVPVIGNYLSGTLFASFIFFNVESNSFPTQQTPTNIYEYIKDSSYLSGGLSPFIFTLLAFILLFIEFLLNFCWPKTELTKVQSKQDYVIQDKSQKQQSQIAPAVVSRTRKWVNRGFTVIRFLFRCTQLPFLYCFIVAARFAPLSYQYSGFIFTIAAGTIYMLGAILFFYSQSQHNMLMERLLPERCLQLNTLLLQSKDKLLNELQFIFLSVIASLALVFDSMDMAAVELVLLFLVAEYILSFELQESLPKLKAAMLATAIANVLVTSYLQKVEVVVALDCLLVLEYLYLGITHLRFYAQKNRIIAMQKKNERKRSSKGMTELPMSATVSVTDYKEESEHHLFKKNTLSAIDQSEIPLSTLQTANRKKSKRHKSIIN